MKGADTGNWVSHILLRSGGRFSITGYRDDVFMAAEVANTQMCT